MSCARCDALAREVADLRSEVEAWRANDDDDARAATLIDRLARWKTVLGGLSHGEVLTLLLLVDRAGRVCTADQVVAALRASPFARSDDPAPKMANVYVCRVRAKFKPLAREGVLPNRFAALDGGITTHWGQGWSIRPEEAAALKHLAGEG